MNKKPRFGHYPEDTREMFREAIEAFMKWKTGEPEPKIEYGERQITISRACGLLWNCTDILPRGDFEHSADRWRNPSCKPTG
jgi:hypothetical protein